MVGVSKTVSVLVQMKIHSTFLSAHGHSCLSCAGIFARFPMLGHVKFLTSGGSSVGFLFLGGNVAATVGDSGLPHLLTFPALVRAVQTEA